MTDSSISPSTPANGRPTESKAINMTAWVLAVLLAVAFLGAGGSKLAGVPMMVQNFDKIGLGQWFRYLTGSLEVVGAVALLLPRVRFYGAILLAAIMVGAIVAHLTRLGTNPSPPIVLLVLCTVLAYMRLPRI